MTSIFSRDIKVYFRTKGAWLNPLLFVLMVIMLFAFGNGPDGKQLLENAAGIIWVVALLAVMLSQDALFKADLEDGALEQLLLSPQSVYLLVMQKVLAHWLMTGIPLVVASPLFALLLGMPMDHVPLLALSLLLGTASLSFIGAVGASLTVSISQGGLLTSLLILPFYVPIVIFGAAVVQYLLQGLEVNAPLMMLAAIFFASFALAPLAIGAGLKLGIDQ